MKNRWKLKKLETMVNHSRLSKKQQQWVLVMAQDNDAEVRMRAVEVLGVFHLDIFLDVLCEMTKDSNDLVRATVCECLSHFDREDLRHVLFHCAKDQSPIVRGYAILSLSDVCLRTGIDTEETIAFIKAQYEVEKNEWVRIALLRSLIILGEMHYIDHFVSSIFSNNYHHQCFALSLLEEMVEDDVIKMSLDLCNRLLSAYNTDSIAVRDKISKLLSQYSEVLNDQIRNGLLSKFNQ